MIRNGSNFFFAILFSFVLPVLCVNFVQKVKLGVGLSPFVLGRYIVWSHRRCHEGALTKSVIWNYWTLWDNICFEFKKISTSKNVCAFFTENCSAAATILLHVCYSLMSVCCLVLFFVYFVCILIVLFWNERKRVQLLMVFPPKTHTLFFFHIRWSFALKRSATLCCLHQQTSRSFARSICTTWVGLKRFATQTLIKLLNSFPLFFCMLALFGSVVANHSESRANRQTANQKETRRYWCDSLPESQQHNRAQIMGIIHEWET